VEEKDHGLFKVVPRHLPAGTEENHKKSVRIAFHLAELSICFELPKNQRVENAVRE
jgi:hypothetical protein